MRLWHTANFWEPTNKDGKNLAQATLSQLSFLPVEPLQHTIYALGGTFSNTEHGLEMYMPLTFENGLVKTK